MKIKYLFKVKYILSLLIITLIIKKIKTILNFKAIYSSETLYIINYDGIYTYNFYNDNIESKLLFTQKLESENEFEMISYDTINNDNLNCSTLIFVKTNIYVIHNENIFNIFNISLNQETGYREIYSNECFGAFCCFFIGCINSNKELKFYFLNYTLKNNETTVVNISIVNSVSSDNFSCQKIGSSCDEKMFTCFYQNNNSELTAINYNITDTKISIISSAQQSKKNNGTKFIKSILSLDKSKSLVCFTNNDTNIDCLIFIHPIFQLILIINF